jgi:hypothetical protein
MKWLPSFVKLFLLFILGNVLTMGSAMAEMQFLGNYTISSVFAILRLVGLVLAVGSPLLIALKFFAQLDRKAK